MHRPIIKIANQGVHERPRLMQSIRLITNNSHGARRLNAVDAVLGTEALTNATGGSDAGECAGCVRQKLQLHPGLHLAIEL